MYIPKVYAENRLDVLQHFIRLHPLGLLVCIGEHQSIEGNLIPMNIYEEGEKGILRCHLAIANSQIESLRTANEVLVVFTGTHGYISPELYQTKKLHGKAVPTWNYSMVQVRGKPAIIDDQQWLMRQINDLTDQLEAGKKSAWKVSDAPEDYIRSQLKSIIGLEIQISNIEGKFKVSQNQPEENRSGVEDFFRTSGDIEMADYVSNRGMLKD